jgi:hypothetical protein
MARTRTRKAQSSRRQATHGSPRKPPAVKARPGIETLIPLPGARSIRPSARPTLDRERRTLASIERDTGPGPGTAGEGDRMLSAARTGHDELRAELRQHTESSPTLTAGDVDARWQDAYAVGDETPGGDNPTPDQDRVDDIGKALGIEYQDDQELMGGEEVAERDRHRWELDPASSDDWKDKK